MRLHRPYNVSAGPEVLPAPVLQQAAAEMLDRQRSGKYVPCFLKDGLRDDAFLGGAGKRDLLQHRWSTT